LAAVLALSSATRAQSFPGAIAGEVGVARTSLARTSRLDSANHVDTVGRAGFDSLGADPVAAAVREYRKTGIAREIVQGTFVTVPFGHAQPTVTCAPLRACVVELEAGESVLTRIAGDTQRWEIEVVGAGADGRTPLVVVKPHDCGLTTNLVLATSVGRIYDLTLDSPPCTRGTLNPLGPYMRHVRFYYPDALVRTVAAPAPAAATVTPVSNPVIHADAFNFSYRVRRDRGFPWSPLAVFDDGVHCYIKVPHSATHGDVPVLFALDPNDGKTLLNYSISRDMYVTDRVFRAAVLVIGDQGSERVLRLDNTGAAGEGVAP
jgi:type IV secretion system protein VirB9